MGPGAADVVRRMHPKPSVDGDQHRSARQLGFDRRRDSLHLSLAIAGVIARSRERRTNG